MRCRFQFRRYRLPFRTAVQTAHGVWGEREGVMVRLQRGEGEGRAVGFGEAAPIPWFGTETADEIEAACRELGEFVDEARLESVPARLGCLRHALAAARSEVGRVCDPPLAQRDRSTADYADGADKAHVGEDSIREIRVIGGQRLELEKGRVKAPPYLGVAALLPAGRRALEEIAPKLDAGFRVFKWKVGVGDVADELAMLDDVCGTLPSGAKVRLDANGAWDRRRAERWLERCAERPIEFIEQPVAADARGAADLLLGLANDFPTPIALDESLIGDGDIERWIDAGWRGVFVVKPLLLADPAAALARLEKAKASVVFSSALETAVGAREALRLAFRWAPFDRLGAGGGGQPRALGFGVWPLFADSRFDGPAAAPFIRSDDVERINPEAVWNALS